MKKLLSVMLVLSLLCGVFVFASAEETAAEPERFTSGDFTYIVLADGTAEIVFYSGEAEKLSIPEQLDGKKVTSIGNQAFMWNSALTSVTIPDSVTSIGNSAFSYCRSLMSVTIPDSVTSIGNSAFISCESLTSIRIPDSVTSIGTNPFRTCDKLTDIIVSVDHPYLATIDGVLFSKPDKRLVCYPYAFTADSYVIPNGIQAIGDNAFYNCSSLTSVTIPDSVTNIGNDAFYSCDSLTSVAIPDSVTSIGNSAFQDCQFLISITIPDSVTSIGNRAFEGCISLTSITIPDSVTSIGENAFLVYLNGDFIPNPFLTVNVSRDSYAAQYCKDNGLKYMYPDSLDWLNN